jgi:hypothetical protein
MARFRGPAIQSGHACSTKRDRKYLGPGFVKLLWRNGIRVEHPRDVTAEHMRQYVQLRLALGHDPRGIQNCLCVVRQVLIYRKRAAFAKSTELTSPALGCPPGCRAGKNNAMPQPEVDTLLESASELDEGLECVLRLQRLLGLRKQEAIMSVQSLDGWAAQLAAGEPLRVKAGAKGGRPRNVHVADREACLDAVHQARVVRDLRGGVLIEGSLQQALKRYEYFMGATRLRKRGHALRYSFAHERYAQCRDAGEELDTALMHVVGDLGHGSGRGRCGRDIYLRALVPVKRKPKLKSRWSHVRLSRPE